MISVSPSGHSTSGRQGIRTLKARRPHGLANRPGEPYPATFRFSGPDGSRTHHTDLARISRLQRHAGPNSYREVRPGVEPGLLPYQGSVQPQHLQTKSSGSGSRTRPVELMRLHWALAHPQGSEFEVRSSKFQVQGSRLHFLTLNLELGTYRISSQGESRTPTPKGTTF